MIESALVLAKTIRDQHEARADATRLAQDEAGPLGREHGNSTRGAA